MDCPTRRESLTVAVAVSLFLASALLAEPVDQSRARKATETFLKMRTARSGAARGTLSAASAESVSGTGVTAAGTTEIRGEDGTLLAYVTELTPRGFVAVSADTDIAPVVAYSFRSSFPAGGDTSNPLYWMLREDLKSTGSSSMESLVLNVRLK